MRLLCVARHAFLSDHLCRYFGELGAQCESAIGVAKVPGVAESFEPHLVIVECDLLSQAVMDRWSREPALRDVPVLAVSLTRRPDECLPAEICGLAGVVFLPALDRAEALALLDLAHRPRGVEIPRGVSFATRESATTL
jgi:hypothetical protein